jgi:hypothetical protein
MDRWAARRGQPSRTVAKLEQDGPLGTEVAARRLIDTLRVSFAVDSEHRVAKAASGGSATALPRSPAEPEGVENAGGDTGDGEV